MKTPFTLFLVAVFLTVSTGVFAEDTDLKTTAWEERSQTAEKWFFNDLPRHVGGDFKETFWNGWHLLLLTVGSVTTTALHEKDREIQAAFDPEDPLGKSKSVFGTIGSPFILGGATLAALVGAKMADAPKATLTAGTMLEAWSLTMALTLGLKLATQRTRPDGSDHFSFPSAHTSGAFALATVTEVFYGPAFGIPSYALASMVGLSRIDANQHFASDVLAGALLGTLLGLGTAKFHKKEFPRFFVIPTTGEGSTGISLVHRF